MRTQRDRLGALSNLSRRVEDLSEENARLRAENERLRDALARAFQGGLPEEDWSEDYARATPIEEDKCE